MEAFVEERGVGRGQLVRGTLAAVRQCRRAHRALCQRSCTRRAGAVETLGMNRFCSAAIMTRSVACTVLILLSILYTAQSGAAQEQTSEVERGPSRSGQIALTFDAGGEADCFADLIAALARARVASTFFITGKWAQQIRSARQKSGSTDMKSEITPGAILISHTKPRQWCARKSRAQRFS